jgi:ABC-type multidrug transport system ATPase subunit
VLLAAELVIGPSILLADEPTSGVDSFTAEILMNVLSSRVRDPTIKMAVMVSLHQPSKIVFQTILDRVIDNKIKRNINYT